MSNNKPIEEYSNAANSEVRSNIPSMLPSISNTDRKKGLRESSYNGTLKSLDTRTKSRGSSIRSGLHNMIGGASTVNSTDAHSSGIVKPSTLRVSKD